MQNWQLTMVILTSVLVGAAVPLLVLLASAVHRAGREIVVIGAQLRHTLSQIDTISVRVEKLSRGLEGGDASVADLLKAVGSLSRSLDRNMKIINVLSTILASVGTAVAAFVQTKLESGPEAQPADAEELPGSASDPPPAAFTGAQEAAQDARP